MRWMEQAWQEIGQREIDGPAANEHILAFYREVGHPEVRRDEVAWCAAFGGATLIRGGIDISAIPVEDRLLANSYLKIGMPLAPNDLRVGAICILTRGPDPRYGHFGYVNGWSETHVQLLSGNASDRVGLDWYPRTRIRGVCWPQVLTPAEMKAAGSRIDGGARQIRNDTGKSVLLEYSRHVMEAVPAPSPAEYASVNELAAAFGQWVAHKWPAIAFLMQAYLVLRIVYHSGLIRGWRAEDASTGKTVVTGDRNAQAA